MRRISLDLSSREAISSPDQQFCGKSKHDLLFKDVLVSCTNKLKSQAQVENNERQNNPEF